MSKIFVKQRDDANLFGSRYLTANINRNVAVMLLNITV